MPEPTAPEMIELLIRQHGETFVKVPRAAYRTARDEGMLEDFLDSAAVRLALATEVESPGGARRLLGEPVKHEAIHTHFGLSYANYLVVPRSLLQSMPDEWQTRFTALLDQLHAVFRHVDQAEVYEVHAAIEREVCELDDTLMAALGITEDWYGGQQPPANTRWRRILGALRLVRPFESVLDEWQDEHETTPVYYDRDGNELEASSRVLLPIDDPVPHYNRGRTHIEPRLEITDA